MSESQSVDAGLDRIDQRRRRARAGTAAIFAVALVLMAANFAWYPLAAYYEQIQTDQAIKAGNPGQANLHEAMHWYYEHHTVSRDLLKIAMTAEIEATNPDGTVQALPNTAQCAHRVDEITLALQSGTSQPPPVLRAGLLAARAECDGVLHRDDLAYADYTQAIATRSSLHDIAVQRPAKAFDLLRSSNMAFERGDVSVAKRLATDARNEDPAFVKKLKNSTAATSTHSMISHALALL